MIPLLPLKKNSQKALQKKPALSSESGTEDDLDVDQHSECLDKNAKDLENVQKALETIENKNMGDPCWYLFRGR